MAVPTARSKRNMRTIVNNPAASYSERVLMEKDLGNGSYLRRAYIEQAVTLAAAASGDLTTQLPANYRVIFASANNDTLLSYGTAVKFGIGTAADPDKFLLSSTTLTKNTKNEGQPLEAVASGSAAVTVRVSAVDTNGAAAGTMTGTVRARLVYEYITNIASAA